MNFKFIYKSIYILNLFNIITCFTTFRFFSRSRPNSYVQVASDTLLNAGFSHNKETKFLVHGFSDSADKTSLLLVKDRILSKYDVNVIVVNWEKGALSPDYLSASANSKIVGQAIANFIVLAGINLGKVHCIGHSLGAHACGFAGKYNRINRISGLDPAGPLFKGKPSTDRLDKTDANYVDNIHTDWLLGIQDPIGHKDFYPNGGAQQPGCASGKDMNTTDFEMIYLRLDPKLDIIGLVSCSHSRVTQLFAESVTSACPFTSVPCTSYDNFKANRCNCGTTGCAKMGYWSNQNTATGNFYLDTNRASPFCLS